MVAPVRKMEGKILVSIAPVITYALVTLDNVGIDAKSPESCGNLKTTGKAVKIIVRLEVKLV